MKFRTDDRYPQNTFCDAGPYYGQHRAIGYVYGSPDEIGDMLDGRDVELYVEPPVAELPEGGRVGEWWWPFADEFPDWHVWRGVSKVLLLYARRPKSSPPKTVSATNVADLRLAIIAKIEQAQ